MNLDKAVGYMRDNLEKHEIVYEYKPGTAATFVLFQIKYSRWTIIIDDDGGFDVDILLTSRMFGDIDDRKITGIPEHDEPIFVDMKIKQSLALL